jgi:hypothetical protein
MQEQTINRSSRMRLSAIGMFLIGLAMWIVVPGGWLYIGSQIKGSSNSLGLAIAVMGVGAIVSIIACVKVLGILNRNYYEDFVALNDRKPMRTPLEPVLVISAGIAIAAFGIWFTFFAGGGGSMIAPK